MGLIKASLLLNLPLKRKRFSGVFALLVFVAVFLFTDSSSKGYFLRPVFDGPMGFQNGYSCQFPPSASPEISPLIDGNRTGDASFEVGNQGSIDGVTHDSIAPQSNEVLRDIGYSRAPASASLENFRGVEGPMHQNDEILSSNANGTVMGRTQLGKLGLDISNVSLTTKPGRLVKDEDPWPHTVNATEVGRSTREKMLVSGYGTECDYFDGRWVRDDTKPYYHPGSCPFVDNSFNCYANGRPDKGYLKWSWQPRGCDLPSFDANDFLERLRGKSLAFVGDSLNRNMWESLVCILRHSVKNKSSVYEISGRTDFKKQGFYSIRFEEYNCSFDFMFSPFLVQLSMFRGSNGTMETLRLDKMDRARNYAHADIIVFNTGHWWTHEKSSKGENYYQEGDHVYPWLEAAEAYRKALTTWAGWIDEHINPERTLVFFRGYSETHFRGGQWNSGGQCHREIEPIFKESYLNDYPTKMKTLEDVLRQMKTPVIFLNVTRLTDYRKDGHPSIYRTRLKTAEPREAAEQLQDCSHWCLPGIPDAWNDLLYAHLLKHLKRR